MTFKAGQSGNPNGRPKGAKNKLPTDVIPRILEVWDKLESVKGKSLYDVALSDPAWFYRNFIKRLVPTNIDLGVFLPQLEKAENLPDSILLGILKDRPKKIESKKPKKATE